MNRRCNTRHTHTLRSGTSSIDPARCGGGGNSAPLANNANRVSAIHRCQSNPRYPQMRRQVRCAAQPPIWSSLNHHSVVFVLSVPYRIKPFPVHTTWLNTAASVEQQIPMLFGSRSRDINSARIALAPAPKVAYHPCYNPAASRWYSTHRHCIELTFCRMQIDSPKDG